MRRLPLFLLLLFVLPARAGADSPPPADFRPDPYSVQRHGPAYRYPQAGWIVLHVEGEPYERGYQHGRLLAPEIAAFVRCVAAQTSPKAPAEGWNVARTLVNALFLRRFEKEYLEEMKGIADGASAAGARYEGRPIDLVDIVGLNALSELETLPSALEATATGLEGLRLPKAQPREMPPPQPMHCSAFVATGPATADGKVVIGHITMTNLYSALFCNVWLDVKPSRGHRVIMQTYPGSIQSGLDYCLNDAGLVVCETTLRQTRFDGTGMSVASRIRQALQYADTIDKAVDVLRTANNGLYTNEWLLADTRTNEIAMLELGTHTSKLLRSSRHEWVGGTEGFYWGCNNTKDLDVRLETVASVAGRPANVVWRPSPRDQAWVRLYHQHKGKIDAGFGKLAFTTPPLAAYHSLDAKVTTTELARDLKSWALFGPPLGKTWQPTAEERARFPAIRPLVSNPWTVLHANAPAKAAPSPYPVADLSGQARDRGDRSAREEDKALLYRPAWHGTLLPAGDADTWLATAFADYERIYSLDRAMRERAGDGKLAPADRERLAQELYTYRHLYLSGTRYGPDVPLSRTRAEVTRDAWYRVAAGKGVWLLHALRQHLGDEAFEEMMDSFGRTFAGKEVTASQFQAHVEASLRKGSPDFPVQRFFTYWLDRPGLPKLRLSKATASARVAGYVVEGELLLEGQQPPALSVEVGVFGTKDETQKTVRLEGPKTTFQVEVAFAPKCVVVDPYGRAAKANGGAFTTYPQLDQLETTLIVYGTADEAAANREAAEAVQRAIIELGSNVRVPVKSDREATDEDLKANHLLLIGRPDSNPVVDRFRAALPLTFHSRSFTLNRQTYAHAGSAVVASGENPLHPGRALVVLAGLSAEATVLAVPKWLRRDQRQAEVLLLPQDGRPQALVVPARELVQELDVKK